MYKPTEEIESVYFTKAFQAQEKLFHTQRKIIIGLDGINEYMLYQKVQRSKQVRI